MKVGSLYIIHNGTAICRFIEDKLFLKVMLEDNGKIVDTNNTTAQSLSHSDPILWSIPPLKRRTLIHGEPVIMLRNGVYTIFPDRHLYFDSVIGNGECTLTYSPTYKYPVNVCLNTIRTAKYAECDANCRKATICWLLVSMKLRLPKDMRRLIGQYIWETRDDREWENKPPPRRGPARRAKKQK